MFRRPPSAIRAAVAAACALVASPLPTVRAQAPATPSVAPPQDAQAVLELLRVMQAARWATVSNYTVTLAVEPSGGLQTPMYYEKFSVEGRPAFRLVPQTEYERRVVTQAGFPPPGPEFAKTLAQGHDMLGDAFAQGGEGAPPMDVRPMTDQMALFLRAGAAYRENDGRADARDAKADLNEFFRRARLVGVERTESGREAFLIVADDLFDLPLAQPKNGGEYRLEKVSLWIDTEHYVPLRLLMDGQVTRAGTVTPITIERLDLDYRKVGPLFESHRQVMRLTGIMAGASAKDRKEMEKARKDLAKAKKQLADMPDGPRKDMVMRMMKPQLDKFERMARAGAFEAETRVVSIAINEGPPTMYGTGGLSVGGRTFPGALTFAADQERDGKTVASISVAARSDGAEAAITLYGLYSFFKSYTGSELLSVEGPGVVGAMPIQAASGYVDSGNPGGRVTITGGSGMITITRRTAARIVGSFEAQLRTEDGETPKVAGGFDTGAPAGENQAPRGSPFPAELFSGK